MSGKHRSRSNSASSSSSSSSKSSKGKQGKGSKGSKGSKKKGKTENPYELILWNSDIISDNLMQFFQSTSPVLKWRRAESVDYLDTMFTNTTCRPKGQDARSDQYKSIRNKKPTLCYDLRHLWEFYDKPFGVPVKLRVDGVVVDVFYTPYLSSMELYGYEPLGDDPYGFTSVNDDNQEEEEGAGGTVKEETESDVALHKQKQRMSSSLSVVSSPMSSTDSDSSESTVEFLVTQIEQTTTKKLLIRYTEDRYPNERTPLVQLISRLNEEQSDVLTKGNNMHLHPESWYTVVWTPIMGHDHSIEMLRGTITTFHRFHLHGDEQRHTFWYSEVDQKTSPIPPMRMTETFAQEAGFTQNLEKETKGKSHVSMSSLDDMFPILEEDEFAVDDEDLEGTTMDLVEEDSEEKETEDETLASVFLGDQYDGRGNSSLMDVVLNSLPNISIETKQKIMDLHGPCNALELREEDVDRSYAFESEFSYGCGTVGMVPYRLNIPIWTHFVPSYSNYRYSYNRQGFVRFANNKVKNKFRGSVFCVPMHLVENALAVSQRSRMFHHDLNHYSRYIQALRTVVVPDARNQTRISQDTVLFDTLRGRMSTTSWQESFCRKITSASLTVINTPTKPEMVGGNQGKKGGISNSGSSSLLQNFTLEQGEGIVEEEGEGSEVFSYLDALRQK